MDTEKFKLRVNRRNIDLFFAFTSIFDLFTHLRQKKAHVRPYVD